MSRFKKGLHPINHYMLLKSTFVKYNVTRIRTSTPSSPEDIGENSYLSLPRERGREELKKLQRLFGCRCFSCRSMICKSPPEGDSRTTKTNLKIKFGRWSRWEPDSFSSNVNRQFLTTLSSTARQSYSHPFIYINCASGK